MPRKYIKMKIDEISAVDKGANDKEFLIIKNYEEETEELNKGGEDNMDELTLEKALETIEDENAKELIKDAISKNENTEEKDEDIDVNKSNDEEGEEINKNELPEAIQKRLEQMESELSATKKIAKQEREKRLDIEFKKKAEGFDQIADIDKVATILRKAHDAKFGDELEEVLKAANERIETGDFTKEVGDEGDDVSDPTNELEKRAKEIRKDHPELSKEQAISKVLEDDPDLYMDYLNS